MCTYSTKEPIICDMNMAFLPQLLIDFLLYFVDQETADSRMWMDL